MFKEMRKESKLGLLFTALYFLLKHLTKTPDFILKIILALSICYGLVGLIPEKAYEHLKSLKKGALENKWT